MAGALVVPGRAGFAPAMTAAREAGEGSARPLAWRPAAGAILGELALAGYLAVGAYLTLTLHAMHGDAYSRVTNAYYVLFSRDPHLGAIGFVWSPLPSLIELLLVPLKLVWPPMVELGFAAVIMSAPFMAAAVYQLDRTLNEFSVPRAARLVLVASFAVHPMIVYYGAAGTAEAPLIFFLVLSVRYLARWLRTRDAGSLVMAGLGLAAAYLTRYEALFSAVGLTGVVLLATFIRTPGGFRSRCDAAIADGAIVVAPVALVFVGWSLASWVIVGSPFAQFSSSYGNASQLSISAAQGANELGLPVEAKAFLAAQRLVLIEVAAPAALGLAIVVGALRRDARILAIVGCLGTTLAFMVLAYLEGALAPWFRYFILAIPLGILLVGLAIGSLVSGSGDRAAAHDRSGGRLAAGVRRGGGLVAALTRATIVLLILSGAVAALPIAAAAMRDPVIAIEESQDLAAVLGPDRASDDRQGAALLSFATERKVAAYLDGLDLPRGSVLLDAFRGFSIVAQSHDPQQFVITPDRDFKAVLADPISFGVRYVLAPERVDNGLLDAINVAYPNLLTSGTGFTELDRTFEGHGNSSRWYVFRIVAP
jgi:hypothetical protein